MQSELAAFAANSGIEPPLLLCVSKTADMEAVREVWAAGARDFGENRIESLEPKAAALPEARWHFIGNIQARKIPRIVACSALIHSVWRPEHLPLLEKAAARVDKVQDILIEVNVSGEASKDGLTPAEVAGFLQRAEVCPHLAVRGLMTMAPRADEETATRAFRGLADLRRALVLEDDRRTKTLTELSMGMSEDWKPAVLTGSTMVRLGRAVFSEDF